VYKLICGYIGQTGGLKRRMCEHKNRYNRNVENHTILAICYTKQEALDLEALYQSLSDTYESMDNKKRIIAL
jgi:predicted GIY-YIG superfamily endonuclease